MGRKKHLYLVLDTETATLPFADEIAKGDLKKKQKIAIAKPLVYDIGWCIIDRQGTVLKKRQYLVQETFFVPNVFNTAYYRDKRPLYMNFLQLKETEGKLWEDIIRILVDDLQEVKAVAAYNAAFDFKKAIPFTEKYIKHLYSSDFNEWEKIQKEKCLKLITQKNKKSDANSDYLLPIFEFRGVGYPIIDIWDVACKKLLNNQKYKDFCMENGLFTESAMYFKSSAEACFQYTMENKEFIEDHTALSDALIEAKLLTKILKKGKVDPSIGVFPFRELGTTYQYTKKKPKYNKIVLEALIKYFEDNQGEKKIANKEKGFSYWKKIQNIIDTL